MKKKTILICDDHEDFLSMLIDMFEFEEYEVIGTENCKVVQAILADTAVDLFITDYMMPDNEDGACLTEIQKVYPSLPIIVMSGDARLLTSFLDPDGGLTVCATFTKPIQIHELLSFVRNYFGESHS